MMVAAMHIMSFLRIPALLGWELQASLHSAGHVALGTYVLFWLP